MRRSILLAALVVALPAIGAAQSAKDEAAKPSIHGEKARKAAPGAKGTAAKKSPASKGGVDPGKATVNPEDRRAMLRMRSIFVYAADACSTGRELCDRVLLEDAEQNFVNACRACASVDRCEAERAAIREGRPANATDLCAP